MMRRERIVPVLFAVPNEGGDERDGKKPARRSVLKRLGSYLGNVSVRLAASILNGDVSSDLIKSLSSLPLNDEDQEDPLHLTIEGDQLKAFPESDRKLDHSLNRLFLKGLQIGGDEEADYSSVLEPIVDVAMLAHFFVRDHGDCLSLDIQLRQAESDGKRVRLLEFRCDPVLQFYKSTASARSTTPFYRAFPDGETLQDEDPDVLRQAKRDALIGKKRRKSSLKTNHSYIYHGERLNDDAEDSAEVEQMFLEFRKDQDYRHFLKISNNLEEMIKSELPVVESTERSSAEKLEYNWNKRKGSLGLWRPEPRMEKMIRLEELFNMFRVVYIFCVMHLDPGKSESKHGFNEHVEKANPKRMESVGEKKVTFSFYRHFQKWILSPHESSRSLAINSLEAIIQITEEYVEKGTKEWLSFVWENDPTMAAEWNTYIMRFPYFKDATEEQVLMWKMDFTECKLSSRRGKLPRGGMPYVDLVGHGEDRCVFERMRVHELNSMYKKTHKYNHEKLTFVTAFHRFLQYPEKEWMKLRRYWADKVRKCIDVGISSLMMNADLIRHHDSAQCASTSKRVEEYIAKLERINLPWTAKDLPKQPGDAMRTPVDSAIRRIADKIRGCSTPYCSEHGSRLLLHFVLMQNVEMAKRVVLQGADVNAKTCMGRPELTAERWMFLEYPDGTDDDGAAVTFYQAVADNVGGPVSSFVNEDGQKCSDPVDFEAYFRFEQVTPLAMACLLGNIELVRFFLDHGANPMLYDAVAIKYCLPGLKEIAARWKAGDARKEKSSPAMECFIAMFKWHEMNRDTYPLATGFKQGFFRQTLLVEALLFKEDNVVDFLLVQAQNQNANEMRICVLEVIDHLLDGGLVTPRATHADVIRSVYTLMDKSRFSVDHHRMQRFCLIIESAVRNNLAGNEQAVIDVLTKCKQLRYAMGIKLSKEDEGECNAVYDMLKQDRISRSAKKRLYPANRWPTLSKMYLRVNFTQNLFDAAFKSGMYRLMELLMYKFELRFNEVKETLVMSAVETQDTTTLDIVVRYLTRDGRALSKDLPLILSRAWHKLMSDISKLHFVVSLREPTYAEKLKKLSAGGGYPKDVAPILNYVIKLFVEHDNDDIITITASILKWMQLTFVATRTDPELQEGSKNVALNEVFAYLVAKLAAEECKELLDLLIDVSSTQNALSWKRTRLFLDHCLQIDDTLIDKKVFCDLRDGLSQGALYASPTVSEEILNHVRKALRGKVSDDILDTKEKKSKVI